jgi:hypothetical protein
MNSKTFVLAVLVVVAASVLLALGDITTEIWVGIVLANGAGYTVTRAVDKE